MSDAGERGRDPVPLAEALAPVVRALGSPGGRGAGGGGRASVDVFRQWEAVVGDAVAAHARPIALEEGRLLVEVDQPGWATQLRYLSATVLERLGASVGEGVVRAIEVRVARR